MDFLAWLWPASSVSDRLAVDGDQHHPFNKYPSASTASYRMAVVMVFFNRDVNRSRYPIFDHGRLGRDGPILLLSLERGYLAREGYHPLTNAALPIENGMYRCVFTLQ